MYKEPNNTQYDGIDVYKARLYACLRKQKRVDVFNMDLELVSTHQLKEIPFKIKLTTDWACIQILDTDGVRKTGFYKLSSFELISVNNKHGPTTAHCDIFCIYEVNSLSLFDKDGNVVDETETDYEKIKF